MLGGIFDENKIKDKIQQFDEKITQPNFWKDNKSAQKILKEKNFFQKIIENFNLAVNELEDVKQLSDLASKENDIAVIKDCEKKS